MYRIGIRLDADHQTGIAHAVRVRNVLTQMKVKFEIFVFGHGKTIAEFFPDALLFDIADANSVAKAIRDLKLHAFIVDVPQDTAIDWDSVVDLIKVPVVAIDDYGGNIRADLIVNGTIVERYHNYKHQPGSTILSGGAYALIHPAFAANPWTPQAKRKLIIVAGGGERARHWIHGLAINAGQFQTASTVIMVGHSFPDSKQLAIECAKNGIELFAGVSSGKVSQILSQSSVALITGGMIVYECMAAGVPSVVFPQEENLREEARWLEDAGCIVNLGYDQGEDIGKVAASVNRLLGDVERQSLLSSNAKSIIDGRGIERVAIAIDNLLQSSR